MLHTSLRWRLAALVVAVLSVFTPAPSGALEDPGPLEELRGELGSALVTAPAVQTGVLGVVRAGPGRVLSADDASLSPQRRALDFLAAHGELVGVSNVASELRVARVHHDLAGGTHVRLDQRYRGLPVFGAQLVVHLAPEGVRGLNGVFVPAIDLDTTPAVSRAAAEATALRSLSEEHPGEAFETRSIELVVYRMGLIEGTSGSNLLTWKVETGEATVFVDASTSRIVNTISRHAHARYRVVHSPDYVPSQPDLFAVRKEDDLVAVPAGPAENLFRFTGQTYDLFANAFDFDAHDGQGAVMRTVLLMNQICPNAYWDGETTNYCPGFDLDDVVAHEWGHAYTDYTHNLIYQCQAGALNESYSDIWGEVVDLRNDEDGLGGSNNAQPYPAGERWLIGEDLTDRVHQLLLRDMWDPERLGDPARVRSPRYTCAEGDNEGVHTNSGIPNHAFAMLVDGKTFNSTTVQGIGMTKAAHIYWQAAAAYQTPTTTFAEHAQALRASCQDLLGTDLRDLDTGQPSGEVIGAFDCAQVDAAIKATDMDLQPLVCRRSPQLKPNPPAPCDDAQTVFSEDFSNGLDAWTLHSEGTAVVRAGWPGYDWAASDDLPGGRTSTAAFAVNAEDGNCNRGPDISGRFSMDSPAITLGAGTPELRFDHYVATRRGADGGNVKISVNGGDFEAVPQEAYRHNAPREALREAIDPVNGNNSNPLAGEFAWTGTDHMSADGSWGTSVVDLSALAGPGDEIVVRFDFGVNCGGGIDGWYVDDVTVSSCPGVLDEE